jgi:hypothetical protein
VERRCTMKRVAGPTKKVVAKDYVVNKALAVWWPRSCRCWSSPHRPCTSTIKGYPPSDFDV